MTGSQGRIRTSDILFVAFAHRHATIAPPDYVARTFRAVNLFPFRVRGFCPEFYDEVSFDSDNIVLIATTPRDYNHW